MIVWRIENTAAVSTPTKLSNLADLLQAFVVNDFEDWSNAFGLQLWCRSAREGPIAQK